jgi:ABC-type proline/glycine betaine transport system ATPase subunit
MINRLIEPSAGRILVDGEDIGARNPVELRRHIGYVIQNVGLFQDGRPVGVIARAAVFDLPASRETDAAV